MAILLAHQSTGAEESDLPLIEERLKAGKKVVLHVGQCSAIVESRLRQLFGWHIEIDGKHGDVGSGSGSSQCSIRRDPEKGGDHSRERQRVEREASSPEALEGNDTNNSDAEECTARAFAQKLGIEAASLRLDTIASDEIPLGLLREWSMRHADAQHSPRIQSTVRGFFVEKVCRRLIERRMQEIFVQTELVDATEIEQRLTGHTFCTNHGRDVDQILFVRPNENRKGVADKLDEYMELDFVYRLRTSGEFVAFDTTLSPVKKFHSTARNEKLNIIAEDLMTDIVLIDIVLSRGEFRYEKVTDRVWRWHLPCSIDFTSMIKGLH
jgi:hypothetical protein